MEAQEIPLEHTFCPVTGRKHYEMFTKTAPKAQFCGACGFANPLRKQRAKPPAVPGPDDQVIELEDSPAQPKGSPASQLMRERPRPVASGLKETQLLPNNRDLAANTAGTRARLMPLLDRPDFLSVAQIANNAIEAQKKGGGGRKPSNQRTGYTFIAVIVLIVIKERTVIGRMTVDTIQSIKEVGEASVKLTWSDLSDWERFSQILVENITRDPVISEIRPADPTFWTQSWACNTNGKNKITIVPGPSSFATPRAFIDSGHFYNNPQGIRKLYYVLTSTTIEDEQVSFPDTPDLDQQDKKRKSKDPDPSPTTRKKVKVEARVKEEIQVKEERRVKEEKPIKQDRQGRKAVQQVEHFKQELALSTPTSTPQSTILVDTGTSTGLFLDSDDFEGSPGQELLSLEDLASFGSAMEDNLSQSSAVDRKNKVDEEGIIEQLVCKS